MLPHRFECHKRFGMFFLLLLGALFFTASIQAQDIDKTFIAVDFQNTPMKVALNQIESKTNFLFSYKTKEMDGINTVTYKTSRASVGEILRQILKGTGYTYVSLNRNIVIKKEGQADENDTPSVQVIKNKRTITGKVVNIENNEPIAGANIIAVDSRQGAAITDANGMFSMVVPIDTKYLIAISYVGYEPKEVAVTNENHVAVSLTPRSASLSSVVITGYTKVDKRMSASAVSTIKGEDMERADLMSVDQMIQGKIPGLNVNITSTTPGAAPKLRLRGTSTLLGSREPIWVVDGFVVDAPIKLSAQDINSLDNENLLSSPIAGVNPSDIERIDVLKDASATAIYGVRGANGVIVITTKQGKFNQKMSVNYATSLNVLTPPTYKNLNIMNSKDRIDVSKEITDRGLNYPVAQPRIGYEGAYQDYIDRLITYDEFRDKVNYFETLNTDWMGILFRPGWSQTHTVNFNAGSQNTTYFASLGFADQNSSAIYNNQKRYTGLFKFNSKLNKNISFGLRMGGAINTLETPLNTNLYKYALNTSRALEFENSDGRVAYVTNFVAGNDPTQNIAAGYNIMNELEGSRNKSRNISLDVSANFEWRFLKNFRFSGNYGYMVSQANGINYADETTSYIADTYRYGIKTGVDIPDEYKATLVVTPRGGEYKESNVTRSSYTIRNSIDYTRTIKQHFVSALLGNEMRSTDYYTSNSFRLGYLPDRGLVFYTPDQAEYPLFYTKFSNGSYAPITLGNKIERYLSWYGIFSYSYKNRYVLNLNLRNDGSNRFGSNVNNRLLPTFSSALRWIISDEHWFDKSKNLNLMALRLSYGFNGNLPESESPELIITQPEINNFTGEDNSYVHVYPNPNLRWEKTNTINGGLEFAFFNNRVSAEAEVYYKKGVDLISTLDIPSSNGIERVAINGASIENKGYELTLNFVPIKTKDWQWRFGVLFGRNFSKILKSSFPEPSATLASITSYYSGINSYLYGNAISSDADPNTLYAYKFTGLDSVGFPTFYQIYTTDYTGTPGVTEYFNNILTPMGSRIPKFDGSFYTNVKYKNWTLSTNFIVKLGYVQRLPFLYNGNRYMIPSVNENFSTEFLNRWQQPGDEAFTNIPGLTDKLGSLTASSTPYTISSTVWHLYNFSNIRVAEASHLRLSSLSIGYNLLPKGSIGKIFNNANIKLQGNDLLVIAGKEWKGRDPETVASSLGRMPAFSLAFNISF